MSNKEIEQGLDEIISQLEKYKKDRLTIPISEHTKAIDNLYDIQNHIVKQCNKYIFALCTIQAIAERANNKEILKCCEVIDGQN